MCGRFALRASQKTLAEHFHLTEVPAWEPRYNIAPTQTIPAVRRPATTSHRELVLLRWGLIPRWANDPKVGNRWINARAESAATKPLFRQAFQRRRCLAVADGFYEWLRTGNKKQPYFLCLREGGPFAFAALWEHWKGLDGELIESCALLTTPANSLVRPIHERMPVILRPEDYECWLDPNTRDVKSLEPLLRPYPAEAMLAYPVSSLVNDPRNDSPWCVKPLESG